MQESKNITGAGLRVFPWDVVHLHPHRSVERDRPRPPHGHDFFVSQRDIAQIMECPVNADEDLRFGIFYGISNNDWRWMDIEDAREKLEYMPVDRAEGNHASGTKAAALMSSIRDHRAAVRFRP